MTRTNFFLYSKRIPSCLLQPLPSLSLYVPVSPIPKNSSCPLQTSLSSVPASFSATRACISRVEIRAFPSSSLSASSSGSSSTVEEVALTRLRSTSFGYAGSTCRWKRQEEEGRGVVAVTAGGGGEDIPSLASQRLQPLPLRPPPPKDSGRRHLHVSGVAGRDAKQPTKRSSP